jgi:hypothetical protein
MRPRRLSGSGPHTQLPLLWWGDGQRHARYSAQRPAHRSSLAKTEAELKGYSTKTYEALIEIYQMEIAEIEDARRSDMPDAA